MLRRRFLASLVGASLAVPLAMQRCTRRIFLGGTYMLNVSSGYDSMASNWKAFLQAWRDAPKEYPNTSLAISVNHDNCESGAQIELLRQRLRLEKLPTSYVDFLRSARVDERRQSHKGDNGLYSLEDVNYLSEVDKDYCRILEEQRIVGADPDYFMYGIEQRSWVSITEFLEGLIVIGKMFPNDYLLMNTKVQTKDGEFECILEGTTYPLCFVPHLAESCEDLRTVARCEVESPIANLCKPFSNTREAFLSNSRQRPDSIR